MLSIELLGRSLAALGQETRMHMVLLLSLRPGLCICELQEILGLSQPTVSHHASVLREAGLLREERQGTWSFLYLVDDVWTELTNTIDGVRKGQLDSDTYQDLSSELEALDSEHFVCRPLSGRQ